MMWKQYFLESTEASVFKTLKIFIFYKCFSWLIIIKIYEEYCKNNFSIKNIYFILYIAQSLEKSSEYMLLNDWIQHIV